MLKWRGLFTCDQQHRDIVTIYTDWPATCVFGFVSMIPGNTGFTSDQLSLRWFVCTHDISQKQKIQIYKFKISISESEITFNLQPSTNEGANFQEITGPNFLGLKGANFQEMGRQLSGNEGGNFQRMKRQLSKIKGLTFRN